MNCQYCRKIFTSDYNLRRHEDEYCPNRDNDGKECSPPKKSRDADGASISSNESMGAHASHDDDDEDTEDESSSENSSDEENDLDYTDKRGSVQGVGSVQRNLASASHGGTRREQSERGRLCANSTCIPKEIGGCPHG